MVCIHEWTFTQVSSITHIDKTVCKRKINGIAQLSFKYREEMLTMWSIYRDNYNLTFSEVSVHRESSDYGRAVIK